MLPTTVFDLRAAAALSDAAYHHTATDMDACIGKFGWCVHDDIQRDDNRVLLCYNDILDIVAIVFRGSTNRQNWLANLDARVSRSDAGGFVHHGFADAFSSVRAEVMARLESLLEHHQYRNVLVTGHSLGGALACLCAYQLTNPSIHRVQVITFGQPRIGDANWSRRYEAMVPDSLRVVHDLDDVPLVPGVPFVHAGRLLHLTSQGVPMGPPGRWWRRTLQWLRGVLEYPKGGLLDHLLPSYISTINKMDPTWST